MMGHSPWLSVQGCVVHREIVCDVQAIEASVMVVIRPESKWADGVRRNLHVILLGNMSLRHRIANPSLQYILGGCERRVA